MENEITNASIEMEAKLSITSEGSSYLTTTAKWATFLSIIGFIGTGIMVFLGVTMMATLSLSSIRPMLGFPASIIGVIYIVLAVLYFFPAYYLYNFASKTKLALYNTNQAALDESLMNLKNTFKFLGIMTIVLISAYIILIPTMLFFVVSKGMAF